MLQALKITTDHETRVRAKDHRALKLWLRLLTCSNLIDRNIRRELRASFDCTLPRFDLLAQLERVPDGLKMSELSRRLMVTSGNVTGLADQLETEGLIVRDPVPGDRRATRLKLTAVGRQRFADMAADHEGWIVQLFGALDRTELELAFTLLGKLKTGLNALPNNKSS
jgi:DNA-binding MarR family transcriptional regulator